MTNEETELEGGSNKATQDLLVLSRAEDLTPNHSSAWHLHTVTKSLMETLALRQRLLEMAKKYPCSYLGLRGLWTAPPDLRQKSGCVVQLEKTKIKNVWAEPGPNGRNSVAFYLEGRISMESDLPT